MFCLLHRVFLGPVRRAREASTVVIHEVLFIQRHLLSETMRPNICRVEVFHESRVHSGHETRFGGRMTGRSGFTLVLGALGEAPLVHIVRRPPSWLVAVLLRCSAGLRMSTALFARGRPGQVQTGGRHALIYLDGNTPMRARSFKRVHFVSEKRCLLPLFSQIC